MYSSSGLQANERVQLIQQGSGLHVHFCARKTLPVFWVFLLQRSVYVELYQLLIYIPSLCCSDSLVTGHEVFNESLKLRLHLYLSASASTSVFVSASVEPYVTCVSMHL